MYALHIPQTESSPRRRIKAPDSSQPRLLAESRRPGGTVSPVPTDETVFIRLTILPHVTGIRRYEMEMSTRRRPGGPAGGGGRRRRPGNPAASTGNPAAPTICPAACTGSPAARDQEIPQPGPETPQPGTVAPGPQPSSAGYGLEAESLPGELTEDISDASAALRLGPTPVSQVRFLMDNLGVGNLFGDSGIRTFGWVEGGYTGASTGSGMLSVQPRQNRFGDQFLLNQIGFALQNGLRQRGPRPARREPVETAEPVPAAVPDRSGDRGLLCARPR